MSGVELDSECKLVYDEIQSKKKHRYCTFKIDEGKIRVDKVCIFTFIFKLQIKHLGEIFIDQNCVLNNKYVTKTMSHPSFNKTDRF